MAKIFKQAVLLLSIPGIIYGAFFFIRINGWQPEAESGLGDFITALNFIFGASVTYLVFTATITGKVRPTPGPAWWWCAAFFMLLLAFDEIYMIHENVSTRLHVKEILIFLTYGLILSALLFVNRVNVLKMPVPAFIFLFFLLAGGSVAADQLFGEGVVTIAGREIDYEQLLESAAALSLVAAFASLAIAEFAGGQKATDAVAEGDE